MGRLARGALAHRTGLVRTAAAVALAVGLALVGMVRGPTGPAAMDGDYNIAVAEFDSVDADGAPVESAEAQPLARSVHDLLRDELSSKLGQVFHVELRPPEETGRVRGSTAERRAQAAETLARRIRADVVVYGTLRAEVPNEFTPEFFLSDRQLQNAEELFGQHNLGSSIRTAGDIARNAVARKELRDQILGRAQALAEFVVGLSYYGAHRYDTALDHFEAARTTAGWDDRDGKEVLYLFLANTAGKLNDLDRAQAFYDAALALNPEYARAQLGRAEVLLHRSRGNCEQGNVDVNGVNAALEAYRRARSARVQPATSDIATKVVFGEGRVHLCLSQALVGDHWADAEREFEQVIAEYEKGNRRAREMAAESHANLGFVHLPAAGDPDAPDRYRRAAADYQRGFDLTVDNERKAFFASMRGFIFSRLHERVLAEEAYALAIRLSQDPVARAGYERARQALAA